MNVLVTSRLILKMICYRAHRTVKGDEVRDIGRVEAREVREPLQRDWICIYPVAWGRCVTAWLLYGNLLIGQRITPVHSEVRSPGLWTSENNTE